MRASPPQKEEWVNILSKGIITIPKRIREQVGMEEGDIAKIKVQGNTIVIEPKTSESFEDIRKFSKKDLEEWIQKDELTGDLRKKTEAYWKDLP